MVSRGTWTPVSLVNFLDTTHHTLLHPYSSPPSNPASKLTFSTRFDSRLYFYHFIIALFIILLLIVVFIYLFRLLLSLYIVRWHWVSRKPPINTIYYYYYYYYLLHLYIYAIIYKCMRASSRILCPLCSQTQGKKEVSSAFCGRMFLILHCCYGLHNYVSIIWIPVHHFSYSVTEDGLTARHHISATVWFLISTFCREESFEKVWPMMFRVKLCHSAHIGLHQG